jgi:hypothetical protein
MDSMKHYGSAEDFRAFEKECLGWAETAAKDHERKLFLQMAKAWAIVAEIVRAVRPIEEAAAAFFDQARPGSTDGSSAPLQ